MAEKKGLLKRLAEGQVWNSIFRGGGVPKSRRQRMMVVLNSVFLHLHPVRLPKHAVKLKFTWCMGGLSFFLFLILTISGILLMFYYRPTIEYAYTDIIDLAEQVPFGIMREIHRWGAHAMVITVWLHMFRVFMTGSYKPPREFNWAIGVILLLLTLLLSFTGYLLPWDQLAIWAITVAGLSDNASSMFGGHNTWSDIAGAAIAGATGHYGISGYQSSFDKLTSAKYWLVGAYNTFFDDNAAASYNGVGFKLSSLTVGLEKSPPPNTQVSEPGALALMSLGLGLVLYRRKRRV